MPRLHGLDSTGAGHHVLARGIERRTIFADDADRHNFLHRKFSGNQPANFYSISRPAISKAIIRGENQGRKLSARFLG